MRKFHLSATSKNIALTVEIRFDNENAWDAHFHGPGSSSLDGSGVVIMVKYLPGSWPCMNMAAFHKDYFYHFSISLSRCCLWNHIAQFWSILGNFLWFFNLISSQTPIGAELEDLGETDPENVIFSKPLNWVFGKTLKYRIKKLNTWPGQLEHALLTFRTPLAST